jgi:hypothetical protein
MVQNQESRVSINWLFRLWTWWCKCASLSNGHYNLCGIAHMWISSTLLLLLTTMTCQSNPVRRVPLDAEFMQPFGILMSSLSHFYQPNQMDPSPFYHLSQKSVQSRLQLHRWIHSPCALTNLKASWKHPWNWWLEASARAELRTLTNWELGLPQMPWTHDLCLELWGPMAAGPLKESGVKTLQCCFCRFCSPKLVVANSAVCKL